MTERMSQSKVDAIFSTMFAHGVISKAESKADDVLLRAQEDMVSLNEHFLYLRSRGYSDEEIADIFDIYQEGDHTYEI